MNHVLITFIGRGNYQEISYRFPDGSECEPTKFLGWSLIDRCNPNTVIVLGTEGSRWEFLMDLVDLDQFGEQELEIWGDLERESKAKRVSHETLNCFNRLLSSQHQIETKLILIPSAFVEDEQLQILRIMADATANCDKLTLDVSHGFRHLPMIAVVAAVYLQSINNVQLENFWYGFYDPDEGVGTVHNLKGLLRLFDWVSALDKHAHSGDYGVFNDLLRHINEFDVEALSQAAFYERMTADIKAKEKLNNVNHSLANRKLGGVANLFQPTLYDRLEWARKSTRPEQQRYLAEYYLERQDYLRTSIFALEAFVTKLVDECGYDSTDIGMRRLVKENYDKWDGRLQEYKLHNEIRNSIVHGTKANRRTTNKLMNSEVALQKAFREFLRCFDQFSPHHGNFDEFKSIISSVNHPSN